MYHRWGVQNRFGGGGGFKARFPPSVSYPPSFSDFLFPYNPRPSRQAPPPPPCPPPQRACKMSNSIHFSPFRSIGCWVGSGWGQEKGFENTILSCPGIFVYVVLCAPESAANSRVIVFCAPKSAANSRVVVLCAPKSAANSRTFVLCAPTSAAISRPCPDVSSPNFRAKSHFQVRTSERNPVFRCPPLGHPE